MGVLLLLVFSAKVNAQEDAKASFLAHSTKYDFSKIWVRDSIADLYFENDNKNQKIKMPEPLGFIGDNYQRFYIHLIAVVKDLEHPNEYFAYGKTRVKNNICAFQGKIKITSAQFGKKSDNPKFKQGAISADILFFEDQNNIAAGTLKGKMKTNFVLDTKGNMFYDAVNFVADGFSNNTFEGTWTSYKTKVTKKCNWGDFRIPNSGDLDIGAGEFSVNDKYLKSGWESYSLANSGPDNADAYKTANKKESEKWWK